MGGAHNMVEFGGEQSPISSYVSLCATLQGS